MKSWLSPDIAHFLKLRQKKRVKNSRAVSAHSWSVFLLPSVMKVPYSPYILRVCQVCQSELETEFFDNDLGVSPTQS